MDISDFKNFVFDNPQLIKYKKESKNLLKELKKNGKIHVTLMHCQTMIAQKYGYNNWHHLHQTVKSLYIGKSNHNNIIRLSSNVKPFENSLYIGQDLEKNKVWLLESGLSKHMLHLGSNFSILSSNMISQWLVDNKKILYVDNSNDDNVFNEFKKIYKENKSSDENFHILDFRFDSKSNTDSIASIFTIDNATAIAHIISSSVISMKHSELFWSDRMTDLLLKTIPLLKFLRDTNRISEHEFYSLDFLQDFFSFKTLVYYSENLEISEKIRVNLKEYLDRLPGFPNVTDIAEKQHIYVSHFIYKFLKIISVNNSLFKFNAPKFGSIIGNKDIFIRLPYVDKDNSNQNSEIVHKLVVGLIKVAITDYLGSFIDNSYYDFVNVNKSRDKSRKVLFVSNNVLPVSENQGNYVCPSQARAVGIKMLTHYESLGYIVNISPKSIPHYTANSSSVFLGKTTDSKTIEFYDVICKEEEVINSEKIDISKLKPDEFVFKHHQIFEKLHILNN